MAEGAGEGASTSQQPERPATPAGANAEVEVETPQSEIVGAREDGESRADRIEDESEEGSSIQRPKRAAVKAAKRGHAAQNQEAATVEADSTRPAKRRKTASKKDSANPPATAEDDQGDPKQVEAADDAEFESGSNSQTVGATSSRKSKGKGKGSAAILNGPVMADDPSPASPDNAEEADLTESGNKRSGTRRGKKPAPPTRVQPTRKQPARGKAKDNSNSRLTEDGDIAVDPPDVERSEI